MTISYKSQMPVKNSGGRNKIAKYLNEFRKTKSVSITAKNLNISFFTLYGILRNSEMFNKTFVRFKKYSHHDHSYALKWAKKIRAINYLGGKCEKCGNKNIFHLSFHHEYPEEKENNIRYLTRGSWEKLVVELKKCILLCRNCHQEEHNFENNYVKGEMLKLSKSKGCSACGYIGKNLSSLSFHHIDKKLKKFQLSKAVNYKSKKEIKFLKPIADVKNEIKKCKLLCFNCHSIEHADIKKFNALKKLIYHKVLYTIPFGKTMKQKEIST